MSFLSFIFKGSAPNDKTGTPARQAADIINNNFSNLDNRIVELENPDGVLKTGDIYTDGLNVDVAADAFEWQIDQFKFLDNPAFHAVLDAATDGYYRKDVLLGNNTGGYNIFKGEEDPTSATEPNLFPVGTIKLGVIDVYGAVITGSIPVDVSGKEDKANKNQSNGYAGLDNSGKIYSSQLPSLNTDNVAEGAVNKYSTLALVMSYVLTGISFATGTPITATDTILSAFGKLQKQIDDLVSSSMTTNTDQTVSGIKTFLTGKFAFRNVANTFSSFFSNSNTASRTYTFQNRNGIIADDTDLATKQNLFTGIVNRLPKSLNANTLTPSRLSDDGVNLSIDAQWPTQSDISFGYLKSFREIAVEDSVSNANGKDLILRGGRAINFNPNPSQVVVFSFPARAYRALCCTNDGRLYVGSTGVDLFKYNDLSGLMEAESSSAMQYYALELKESNNNMYGINSVAGNGTPIVRNGNTGAFTNLSAAMGGLSGVAVKSNGDVIWSTSFIPLGGGGIPNGTGQIYLQTGGTGALVSIGEVPRNYADLCCRKTTGDVWVCVWNGDIYKQTGGTGSFNSLSAGNKTWTGIDVDESTGDVWACGSGLIYKQTSGVGAFVSTGVSVSDHQKLKIDKVTKNIYISKMSGGDVLMLQSASLGGANLNGGKLKLKSGTAKGTGTSRVEVYTGQKTVSGTDMQVETLRAYYDENGNYVNLSLPTYANDAAADSDINLPSKAYYKVTASRGVFQKP